jgi:hypothetical protein
VRVFSHGIGGHEVNDLESILKIVPYFLLLPVIFAIPLIIYAKTANVWIEANTEKKNRMSLYLCVGTIILCVCFILLDLYNSHRRSFLSAVIYFAVSFHFSAKKIRDQGGFKDKTISGGQSEAFKASITGAWHSKYHWGTIVQVLSVGVGLLK